MIFSVGARDTNNTIVSFFFFSSRRRHTRLQGDWSSDVCSSDLQTETCPARRTRSPIGPPNSAFCRAARSEERRVGKECRSRWGQYHEKKNTHRGRGGKDSVDV